MAIDWEKAKNSSGSKKKKSNIDWEKAGAYTENELNASLQKKSVSIPEISTTQNSNKSATKPMTPSKAMKAPTTAEAMEWATNRDRLFGNTRTASPSASPAANLPQADKSKTNIENTIAMIDDNEKKGVSTKNLTQEERNQKAWEKTAVEYGNLDEDTYALLDTMADVQDYEDRAAISAMSQMANRGSVSAGADNFEASRARDKATVAEETLKKQGYTDDEIKYLTEYRRQQRNAERSAGISQIIQDETKEHPVLASGLSVMTNLASPLGVVEAARAKAKGVPIDPNSNFFAPTKMTSDIRGEVQENHDWNVDINNDGKSWDAFDFVYGSGMSMADSVVAGTIMPSLGISTKSANWAVKALAKTANSLLGGSLIGAQAMSATMQDVARRGGTTDQAINAGVVSFLAETLSEAWSIGNFKGLQESGKRGLTHLATDLLKSSGVNASEETITEVVNLVYDRYALGKKSNFELNVQAYMQSQKEDGTYYTREEAEQLAWWDSVRQVGEAAAGGFFQGLVMGGAGATAGRVQQRAADSQMGAVIRDSGEAANVINAARASDDKAVQEWVKRINKTDKTTGEVNVKDDVLGGAFRALVESESTGPAETSGEDAVEETKPLTTAEKVEVTNPTLGREDGKAVSLSSIEKVTKGEVTVKNSNGETQKLDIDSLSDAAKKVWSYAAENFTDKAAIEGFVQNYEGGRIETYGRVYKAVYDLAATGMTAEQILKEDLLDITAIGQKAFNAAVEAGNKSISYKIGVVDLTTKPKTNSQKLTMQIADSFGKRHGLNIVFVDTLSRFEGRYTPNSNQIVIALDASGGAISRTLGHETYHYVKHESPLQAKNIEDFVILTMTRLKGKEWVDNFIDSYDHEIYPTLEARTEEFVADQMFEVFSSERAVKEFVAKDMSFAQKVLSHIRNAINEIKNIFKKLVASGNYEDIAAWQNDLDALEKLNDMMVDALNNIEQKNASESKTEKNTAKAVDDVLFSRKRFTLTESDIHKNMLLVGSMDNVVDLSGNEFAKGSVGLPDQVDAFFAKYNYSIENPDIGDVEMNRRGAKDSIAHGIGRIKAASFAAVPYTIEKGKIIDYQKNWKGRQYDTIVLAAPISIKGERYYQGVIVIRDVSTQRFYLHEVLTEKESDTSFKTGVGAKHTPGDVSPSLISLLKNMRDVNKNVSEDVVYSTKRATETTEFKRWFGDWQNKPETASKIVNADGTPKVMYHGTPNQFTVFDKKKARASGFYGRGFYFTDNESHSSHYGKSMAVYLDVKNPLEQGKNHISKKQLRKFLEAVAENEDDYDIWNYGTEDISEIIDSIYKDDAFAVIQDVNATAIGDFAEAIALFNKVNGTSYDGIVTPTETVVYEPTQIKSVDNIGTYDGSNDDIYFSTKRGADQKQKQLDIINETNPAPNTYSTWIRTVDDIKTLSETLEDGDWEYEVINPDLTRTDIQNAIESGEITVYSSYPIENGVFVSPSRMEAESYSGDGRVYEKTVDINDVAWIDPTQGQYAKVDDVKFSTKRDTDYMTAVESGDTETARKMVDEAAKSAGYTIKAYHGTLSKGFTVFDKSYIGSRFSYDDIGFFFIDRRSIAEDYARSEFDASRKGTVFETYLKIKNPLIVNKQFCLANGLGNPFRDNDVIGVWDSYSDYIKEEAEGIRADGIILDDGMSKMFVVYDSNQIKSADPVTFDDKGKVIPLSQRFDTSEDDIRFATKRHWKPNMPKADLDTIKRMAKNELFKTDNYLDNITKWLYNNKNGRTYFALYSTEDESEPTILYASIDGQAVAEYSLVTSYLNELGDESDDGKAKTFNEILEMLENSDDLRAVYSGLSSNRRDGNGDVSVHSRPSRSGISRALLNCLQDCYERRRSVEEKQKYSTKRETSVSEEASDYIQDTKEYREVIDIINQRYNLTNRKKLSPKAIDRFAGKLLAQAKSKYDRGALTERLNALFDYMANSGNELVWEDVMKTTAEIAYDILAESSTIDRSMQSQYKDTLDYLKGVTVYISPEVRAEIDSRYGSLENYRKSLGGKIKITVTDSSRVSLDSLWQELNGLHPEMFDAETTPLDQAEELANFFEMVKPRRINQYDYYMDMNEAAYDFALQIYDEYFNIPEIHTEAQRYALKEERLKGKYNAKVAEIRKGYEERIKKIRSDYQQRIKDVKATDRERYEKLRSDKNRRIEETKALYRERNRAYREKRNDTQERQRLRSQIVRTSKKLTNMLVNPTDQKHIPQELIAGINSFAKTMTEHGAFSAQKAASLQRAFAAISEKSADPDFNIASMYDESIEEKLVELTEILSGKRLSEMSAEELRKIRDIANYLSHIVTMSNQAFSEDIKENLSVLQENSLSELSSQKTDKKRMWSGVQTGLLKPVTFFELLESPTLEMLYTSIRKGEEKWARSVLQAKEECQRLKAEYGYEGWKDDKVEIETVRGDKLSITVKEALSIYATSKRKQGAEHIMVGGIVLEEKARKQLEKKNRFRKNKDGSVNVRDLNVPLSLEDIQAINGQLTEEQTAYADSFVKYMSKDMARYGNEVSMRLYGIQKFNEDYYFPIKSASSFLYTKPGVESDARIKHMSMTKRTVPKANNPVVIGDFTETAMSHCNDMALYYAFTLPLEDFSRVWNYRTPATESEKSTSVKQKIDMIYGSKANRYIKQLLTDINGGVTQQAGTDEVNKMIGLAKKNAVFGSLSVAVQQPSAIARAMAYVNPKYFFGWQRKGTWEELKRYAPVAVIKEMGYFDTNIGKQAVEWMTETEYSGLKEKAAAFFTDGNFRDDILSYLPAFMDEVSWGRIWVAVKNEIAATRKDLDVGTEEFFEAAAERFTYVIDRTQVYDSVFARSEWMRSKDTGVKTATAFMSEPLASYNLLYNAVIKAKNGNKKFAARAIAAYAVSVVFNSLLKSLVTAGRDDDEDKSYWEKYLANLVSNIVGEPLGMIPYIKDIISIFKGYDSNRMDTQVIADIADAVMILNDSKKTVWDKVKSVLGAVGIATGVPIKNLIRDSEMVIRGARNLLEGKPSLTTSKGIEYAIKEKLGGTVPTDYEQLVEAFLSGDTKHYDKVYNALLAEKDEKTIQKGIKSALKEGFKNGDVSRDNARKIMREKLEMDADDIYWTLDEWESPVEDGESYSKYDDFYDAVSTGKNIASVARTYTQNGVSKKTLAGQITSEFKSQYIELYRTNPSKAATLKNKLLNAYVVLGYDRKEKSKDIDKWVK